MNIARLQDTRVNLQKLLFFLYASNKQLEFEIKYTIPFKLAPSKKKYLGINLIKYVQDLYKENHKTLMKEIKEYLHKWRDILCLILRPVLPNLIYRDNAIPAKTQQVIVWISTT